VDRNIYRSLTPAFGITLRRACVPLRWRDFLVELCRQMRCDVANVISHDLENRNPAIRFALGQSDKVVQEWNAYYGNRHPTAPNLLRAVRRRGFMLSAGSLSDAPQAVQDTDYGHWQRRLDLFHSVITIVPSGLETFGSLNLVRPQSSGAFGPGQVELVQRLIPHLQRVFQIQGKLETLRAYSEAGKLALDQLDVSFVAVDPAGCVVLMNQRAEDILRTAHGITMRERRLTATDSSQSGRLGQQPKLWQPDSQKRQGSQLPGYWLAS
jgi:hypothetical protein